MGAMHRWMPVLLAVAVSADTHENCVDWAASGECEANAPYMLKACADACAKAGGPPPPIAESFYDLEATTAEGETLDFGGLRGKVVLVTNVASE